MELWVILAVISISVPFISLSYRIAYVKGFKTGANKVLVEWKKSLDDMGVKYDDK